MNVDFGMRIAESGSKLNKRQQDESNKNQDGDDLCDVSRLIKPDSHSISAAINEIRNDDQEGQ